MIGGLLAAALSVVALLGAVDPRFRAVFGAARARPGAGYLLQLELMAAGGHGRVQAENG
jgi:hypothetical protein